MGEVPLPPAGSARATANRGYDIKSKRSCSLSTKALTQSGSEPVARAAYRKVGENGTLSHFVPSRRVRVFNYLKHIGEPVAPSIRTRVIGTVELDTAACDSCRMCAVFCPTGALEKHDGEDFFGVLHRPAKCMQCRLCESICPHHALTVSDTVPTEQFMGKKAVAYKMEKPTWEPNTPTSMYSKVHEVIGKDLEMCSF